MDHDASGQPTPGVSDCGGGYIMTRPSGVKANAPYVGHTPTPPAISVPIAPSYWTVPGDSRRHGEGMWTEKMHAHASFLGGCGGNSDRHHDSRSSSNDSSNDSSYDSRSSTSGATSLSSVSGMSGIGGVLTIYPSLLNAGLMGLTAEQLGRITGNVDHAQTIHNTQDTWTYERRRTAQPVLDFLYLGPVVAARDRVFLQREGITMLLAARDSRLADARLMSVSRTAADLGTAAQTVDIPEGGGAAGLIKALRSAIHIINEHMLGGASSNTITTTTATTKPRKVLVFCETGSGRSAAIVAAYLMTVYALGLIEALQLVIAARFCVSFEEDTKRILLSYSDILQAQRDVAGRSAAAAAATAATAATVPAASPTSPTSSMFMPMPSPVLQSTSRHKRRIEETMDVDDDRMEAMEDDGGLPRLHLDMARYQNRETFVPFVDTTHPMN